MNPRDVTGEGASSILRAVGSLLVALSGGDQARAERTLSEMQSVSEPADSPPSANQPTRQSGGEPAPPHAATPPPRAYPQPQGRPAHPEPSSGTPHEAARSEGVPSDLLDEVEFVLADARERAQAIIDESTERARELIRQERATHAAPFTGVDPRAFDDLRRGLRGLVTEVRDIQQRLARIEQLIRDQNARSGQVAADTDATDPRYPEPRAVESAPLPAWSVPGPAYDEPAPEGESPDEPHDKPSYEPDGSAPDVDEAGLDESAGFDESGPYAEPEFEASSAGSEAAAAISEPPAPAAAPPRSAFSVVPPQRREWGAPAGDDTSPTEDSRPDRDAAFEASDPPAPAAPPDMGDDRETRPEPDAFEPPPAPPRSHWDADPPPGPSSEAAAELASDASWDDESDDQSEEPPATGSALAASSSPLVTFLPSDGAITLRVAPVAGFQGLMRIQDALTRLPVVRHASVEAYSQGEARLRIELADTADSDELAEGLGRALRGPARVEDASEVHRELLIALR